MAKVSFKKLAPKSVVCSKPDISADLRDAVLLRGRIWLWIVRDRIARGSYL